MRQRKKHPRGRIKKQYDSFGGAFRMGRKKNYYSEEVKRKAIEMKVSGQYTNQEIMEELGIVNKSQIKTWMRWFRKGEQHRLAQPIGKQYSYGKGPEKLSEIEQLKKENRYLQIKLEISKKYQEIERRWFQRS